MEAKQDRTKCQYAERDIFKANTNNPYQYAAALSQWTFARKLELLTLQYQSMANNDPKKHSLRADIDHHTSRKLIITQQV